MTKRTDQHQRPRTRRKRFFTLRVQRQSPSRGGAVIASGLGVLVPGVVVVCVVMLHRREDPAIVPAELLPQGGDVRFAAGEFKEGRARFYRYATAGGREIRFFVMRTSGGLIRTALDGCEICVKERRGYRQAGNAMVCNTCGRSFPSTRIGLVHGDCNPMTLERVVEGDQLLLKAATLKSAAAYF